MSQTELLNLKIEMNNLAQNTTVLYGSYYMTSLLNVLSKKDKSQHGKVIFDHFNQNIKSIKYISIIEKPELS